MEFKIDEKQPRKYISDEEFKHMGYNQRIELYNSDPDYYHHLVCSEQMNLKRKSPIDGMPGTKIKKD
ncbi:hypothetical protein IJ556_00105 [bacterium]|nr:hypothetical protein [bacterium]